ncbi:MAG: hypothetical protein U9R41_05480 [Candidatus Marinimicrobia bacterium]|nr:hypothetical protein [Candidatus Neomarinimicrobiota bacterium]
MVKIYQKGKEKIEATWYKYCTRTIYEKDNNNWERSLSKNTILKDLILVVTI